MSTRKSIPIPNSNPVQEKFINYIMLQGKKAIARKIFLGALEEIRKKTNKDPDKIFEKAVVNVTPTLEVRPKRIGGAVYQIPLEVKPSRQTMLAFRWLREGARNRKGAPMYKKLADELLEASNEQGHAFKKKEDTTRMAQANKAFAHLARY